MKVFVLLCALGAAFAAREPLVHSCLEKPDGGMCEAYIPSYYYDPQTGKCEKFIYGGCGGNGNRYATEEQCLQHCSGVLVKQSSSDVCSLEAETGLCRGYFPRYFFNKKTGQCQKFIYGGCGGNENNFNTVEDCQDACVEPEVVRSPSDVCSLDKESGMCLAYMPRFYHNKETGRCEEFIYGGCQGNGNNFKSLEECEATCPPALYTQSACDQPKEVGLCKARIPRYYFNGESGKCELFFYGGCGGNDNNFRSQADCEAVCE